MGTTNEERTSPERWNGACGHAACASKPFSPTRPVHTVPTKRRRGRRTVLAVAGAAVTVVALVLALTAPVGAEPTDCKSVASCSGGLYPLRRPPVLGEAPVPVVARPTFTG